MDKVSGKAETVKSVTRSSNNMKNLFQQEDWAFFKSNFETVNTTL